MLPRSRERRHTCSIAHVTRTKRPDGFLGIPAVTLADAAGVTGEATGVVMTPGGSETFAGATDAALLKIVP